VEPIQEDNGGRTASEVHVRIFLMSVMSGAAGKAAVDGLA
jgi:hypothetical protein